MTTTPNLEAVREAAARANKYMKMGMPVILQDIYTLADYALQSHIEALQPATAFIDRLTDMMAEDLMATPDDEILREAVEDGMDIDAVSNHMKKSTDAAIKKYEAQPVDQKEAMDGVLLHEMNDIMGFHPDNNDTDSLEKYAFKLHPTAGALMRLLIRAALQAKHPAPVDVEKLKKYVDPELFKLAPREYDYRKGYNQCLDDLISTGIIVPKGDDRG